MRLRARPLTALLAALLTLLVLPFVPALSGCAAPTTELVVQNGGHGAHGAHDVVAHLTLAQLQDLPQVQIATPQSMGNQVQQGPTIRSVLQAAGIGTFERLRVEGRDPAQTFTAAELTDRVILSVTKRDTVKLAGADLARERWVRDVTTLVVNP